MDARFTPSTPSGSFARSAIAQLIDDANWADGVLLAGDFGRNSETTVFLETFLEKFNGLVIMAGDSLDYFVKPSSALLARKNTLLVIDFAKLQILAKNNRPQSSLKHSMNLHELIVALKQWSEEIPASFCTIHSNSVIVSTDGKVSTTPVKSTNFTELAAYLSIWWLQHPHKPFKAFTTAIWNYKIGGRGEI